MLDGGFATTVVHSHETVAVVAFAALGMLFVLHVFWTFCSTGFEELCSSCSQSVVSFDRSIDRSPAACEVCFASPARDGMDAFSSFRVERIVAS